VELNPQGSAVRDYKCQVPRHVEIFCTYLAPCMVLEQLSSCAMQVFRSNINVDLYLFFFQFGATATPKGD
jgi:hypothetical protein